MAAEVKKPVEMTQIPELGEGNINHLSATSKEVDNALSTYQQLGTYEYTQEEEKAVLRKIDLWMMPTMALSFGEMRQPHLHEFSLTSSQDCTPWIRTLSRTQRCST